MGVSTACRAMKWASRICATVFIGSMKVVNSSCVHRDGTLYNCENVVYAWIGRSYAFSTVRRRISQKSFSHDVMERSSKSYKERAARSKSERLTQFCCEVSIRARRVARWPSSRKAWKSLQLDGEVEKKAWGRAYVKSGFCGV